MIGLTIYDLFLFPIYFYLIFLVFKKIRLKYATNKKLYLYFTWGFRIKMAIIIVYTLLTHFVIRGDAVDLYYGEGVHFAQLIKDDISKVDLLFTQGGSLTDDLASPGEKGYLAMENNFMVVKISVILCFLTFSSFFSINLIIGFIAFLGSWQLYLFFISIYPKLHKELAFACMGIPTVLFWSSGISKDTICITCLAVLTRSLYNITSGKKSIRNIVFVIISAFLIYQIKSYIIFSYVPFFLLFLIIRKINKTEIALFRYALKASIPLLFLGVTAYVISNSQELFKQYSSDKILENIAGKQNAFNNQGSDGAGSFFSLGQFDGSVGGLVAMAPQAVVATFFRPFVWESRNLIMLLSSLEAMALLLFTLQIFFKPKGIQTFFGTYFKNAFVFYCISFALLFAVFVGLSTYNFGSLVRYKIPCISFFLCGLIVINHLRIEKVNKLKLLVKK